MNQKSQCTLFSTRAEEYDRLQPIRLEMYEFYHNLALDFIPLDVDSEFRMLDLGCGTGTFLYTVLEKYPKATAVAIDYSNDMLRIAARKMHSFTDRVEFHQRDLNQGLPDNLGSFQLVSSFSAIHHLTDENKARIFRQIHEALVEAGWFFLIDAMSIHFDNDVFKLGRRRFRLRQNERFEAVGIDLEEEARVSEMISQVDQDSPEKDRISRLSSQIGWLNEAGFRSVDHIYNGPHKLDHRTRWELSSIKGHKMKRKPRSPEFKSQVALEALKNQKTINELAAEYEIHQTQIGKWKKQLLEGLPSVFADGRAKAAQNDEALQARLYEEIGRLKVELDWVKKKLPHSVEEKRRLIDPRHPDISLRKQCQLIGLSRSGYYYPPAQESPINLLLMRLIDQLYTRRPFYGSRRMTTILNQWGHTVNRKRVQRLMRKIGLRVSRCAPLVLRAQLPLSRQLQLITKRTEWQLPRQSGSARPEAIVDAHSG